MSNKKSTKNIEGIIYQEYLSDGNAQFKMNYEKWKKRKLMQVGKSYKKLRHLNELQAISILETQFSKSLVQEAKLRKARKSVQTISGGSTGLAQQKN